MDGIVKMQSRYLTHIKMGAEMASISQFSNKPKNKIGPLQKDRRIMGNPWYGLVPAVSYLLFFYLIPVIYLLSRSFKTTQGSGIQFSPGITLSNYVDFFTTKTNYLAYARSIGISLLVVLLASIIAYVVAYTIVFLIPKRYQQLTLLLIIAPFWTSFVIRAFAWQLLLAEAGPISIFLQNIGVGSLKILNTHIATIIGLTVFGTMMLTLNLYSVMENINPNLLAAAADLGARRWSTFKEVVFPLSRPGLLIGAVLTFIISFGDYVVPSLLGGGVRIVLSQAMVGAMTTSFNIPRASTYAMIMLVTILIVTLPVLRLSRVGLNSE